MLLPLLLASLGNPSPEPVAPSPNHLLALAPESAVSVLAIGNLDELRDVARKNAFFRFGRDEQVAALVDDFLARIMQGVAGNLDLGELLGEEVDLAEVAAALHGSAVLFSVFPHNDPERTVAGLLLEPGEDRSGFDHLLGKLLDRLSEDATITGSEYGGAPLTTVEPKNQWNEGAVLVAELGDAVVLMGGSSSSTCREELTGILDRWAGRTDSGGLLSGERYRDGRASLGFAPSVEFHLDLGALWNALRAAGELEGEDVPKAVLDEVSGIRWVHAGARIGEGEELDLQVGMCVPEEGILASFRGLFGGIPIELLRRVPRTSTCVSTLSLDVHGLVGMVTDIVRSLDKDGYQQLQKGLESVQALGVDVETDLLGQLTGEFARFSIEVPANESLLGIAGAMAGAANGDDPVPTYASATLIGLRDADAVEATVDRLIASHADTSDGNTSDRKERVRERVVEGHTLHTFDLGLGSVNWAFTPGGLALGLQPTPVLEALRMTSEDAPSILEKTRFAERIQACRGATCFSIRDTATNLKSVLAGLARVSRMLPLFTALTGNKLPRNFPISAETPWPSPSIAARYFEGTIVTALTWDEQSLRFRVSAK